MVFEVFELLEEAIVEILERLHGFLHFFSRADKVSDAEVVCAFTLAEATAGHGHDASLVHHSHAVKEIGCKALSFSLFDELFWEIDPGEGVHGALNLVADNALTLVEHLCDQTSPVL